MKGKFFHKPIVGFAIGVIFGSLITGCASDRVKISYLDWRYKPPVHGTQGVVHATINGVPGYLVVDTGAMLPTLTQTAVERCGIVTMPSKGFAVDAWGDKSKMMVATNVTVQLAPNLAVYWRYAAVLPTNLSSPEETNNNNFFGILDYRTLNSHKAVIDLEHKTVTMEK